MPAVFKDNRRPVWPRRVNKGMKDSRLNRARFTQCLGAQSRYLQFSSDCDEKLWIVLIRMVT